MVQPVGLAKMPMQIIENLRNGNRHASGQVA